MSTRIMVLVLGLCMSIFVQCKKSDKVIVKLSVKGETTERTLLAIGKESNQLVFDEQGNAVYTFENISFPKFARFHYGTKELRRLYLEPGKEINISIENNKIVFGGENSKINEYLNTRKIKRFSSTKDTSPEELFSGVESSIADNIKNLNSWGLDKNFVKFEKENIRYIALQEINSYSRARYNSKLYKDYQFSESFFKKLESYLSNDAYLMNIVVYRSFIRNALQTLVTGNNYKDVNYLDITFGVCDYAATNFTNPKLVEHVIHRYGMHHVGALGTYGTEKIVSLYKSNVKDPDHKKEFWDLYNKMSKISKGEKSVPFNYKDINGKAVKLEDLKGKYIYIDLWATWCTPCVAEIPYLQKLEKEFHGKNIYFVSISSDQNTEKWEKKVRKDNLGGIQLIMGEDKSFKKAYQISGIPRFILLDPDGRIVEANCTRPSNPKTRELLSSLPGI